MVIALYKAFFKKINAPPPPRSDALKNQKKGDPIFNSILKIIMTSFKGLLPPCENCGHRNPIGFGLEKQIRKEEEAKFSAREKALEAKFSAEKRVLENKSEEDRKDLLARHDEEIKKIEIKSDIQIKESLKHYKESEDLIFEARKQNLEEKQKINSIQLNTEINNLKADIRRQNESYQKEIENIRMKNSLREKENKIRETEIIHKKDLEQNKYKQMYEDIQKRLEEIKRGTIQNSKLKGEGFEQPCFDIIKTAAINSLGRGKFIKDNHLIDGMKADAIYEENDEFNELIFRIIFEMKSQIDPTSNKRKNNQFFEPLYQNKLKKNADIAVLVSDLEPNSEFYNRGIVPIHTYENMYVIRPQFIDCFISIMRNIYIKNMEEKRALIIAKEISQDRLYLEQNINLFRTGFLTTTKDMLVTFDKGIKYVDEAIEKLKKGRNNLYETRDSLKYALGKVEDFTIEKLTSSNKFLEPATQSKNK